MTGTVPGHPCNARLLFYLTILLSSFIACHGTLVISSLLFCMPKGPIICPSALGSRNLVTAKLLFGCNAVLPHIWWQRWNLTGQLLCRTHDDQWPHALAAHWSHGWIPLLLIPASQRVTPLTLTPFLPPRGLLTTITLRIELRMQPRLLPWQPQEMILDVIRTMMVDRERREKDMEEEQDAAEILHLLYSRCVWRVTRH